MDSSKIINNPNIQYCTYGEILRLALVFKYENDGTIPGDEEQLSFVDYLISDVNTAIEDREIIPIDLVKSESTVGDYSFYLNKIKRDYYLIILIALVLIIKYLWDNPAIRNDVLRHEPNADIWGAVSAILFAVVISALVPLIRDIYKLVKIFILNVKRGTATGSIKYQLQEARYRGYIDSAYYTNSVLDFLKSKYAFEITPERGAKTFDDVIYASAPSEVPKYLEAMSNNPLMGTGGLFNVIGEPRSAEKEKEMSEKMSRIANIRHAPRRDAEKKIAEFIRQEIPPPCTCYHNQIARDIKKNQHIEGFPAPLTFINKNCVKEKISDTGLLAIAKRVMSKYDSSRVYDKTMKLSQCEKHRVR